MSPFAANDQWRRISLGEMWIAPVRAPRQRWAARGTRGRSGIDGRENVAGAGCEKCVVALGDGSAPSGGDAGRVRWPLGPEGWARRERRSEEHTSELQSQSNLVCRLLL